MPYSGCGVSAAIPGALRSEQLRPTPKLFIELIEDAFTVPAESAERDAEEM